MTIREAAARWEITERRVNELCKTGRIPGAYKDGKQWIIPDHAQKPADKRMKSKAPAQDTQTMRRPLPVGVSDFRDACSNYYYVDKTMLIRDFLDERAKVSLFTRPRRFGKTLNMDMLRVFFEHTLEDTSVYFKDKKIWSCGASYTQHQGQYPVIFLTFKDVKCLSWADTFQKIRKLISLEFMRHSELETSEKLNTYEKQQYRRIAGDTADEMDYQMGLQLLSLLLHKHWGGRRSSSLMNTTPPFSKDTAAAFMRKSSISCAISFPAA